MLNNKICNEYSKLLQKKSYSKYLINNRLLIIKYNEETNDRTITFSNKFLLPYSGFNKTINDFKVVKFYIKSNPNKEMKSIEPTGIIADVLKNY